MYSQNGFTLIELMVVLGIVGLIMGVAVVGLDSLTPTSQLNASARELAAALALAHNRAVTLGKPVAIHYNFDKKYYRLLIPSKHNPKVMQPTKSWKLSDGVYYDDIMVTGYRVQKQGWLEIKISPLGFVPAHVVHLAHQKGGKVTLEVNPITGLVKIWDGYQMFHFLVKDGEN